MSKDFHKINNKWFFYLLCLILFSMAVGAIASWSIKSDHEFNSQIFIYGLMCGFIAQAIDGALGMAYGVTSTTFLLSIGIPPATASASTHIAEIFTTGASGLSHWRMGTINKKLFKSLLIPGIIGGVAGAFLITNVDGNVIKPYISTYLLVVGFYIFAKAFKKITVKDKFNYSKISSLGLIGGFVDAVGGGGWGPVVTTTLVGSGHDPKKTIASVNGAEFFVTMATGFSFLILIGLGDWEIVAGLIIGGLIAAPFAAYILTKIPTKLLIMLVGILIITLSVINLYRSLI